MQVQSLSHNIHTQTTSSSKTKNSHIDALEKERSELQKEIAKVNGSKDDPQTKAAKLKDLNEKIEDINSEIANAKLEESKQAAAEAQEKLSEKLDNQNTAQEKDIYKGGVVISKSFNHLISASGSFSDYKTLKSVRTEILNRMRTGGENVNGNSFLSKPGSQLASVEGKMLMKVGAINKDIKLSAKDGARDAEKLRKARNHEEDEENKDTVKGKHKHKVEKDSAANEILTKQVNSSEVKSEEVQSEKDSIDTYA